MVQAVITFHYGALFKEIFRALTTVLDEVRIDISPNGVLAHGMAPDHVSMVYAKFEKAAFERLEGEGKFLISGDDMLRLLNNRLLKAKDIVTLEFNNGLLKLKYEGLTERIFKLPLLYQKATWYKPFKFEVLKQIQDQLTNNIVLLPAAFRDALHMLNTFGEYAFMSYNKKLHIKVKKEETEPPLAELKVPCISTPATDTEAIVAFHPSYAMPLIPVLRISSEITIKFGTNVPVSFIPNAKNMFEFHLMVAPRIVE